MTHFLVNRLFQFCVTLAGVTVLTFLLMHLAPGDPVDTQAAMNPRISPEARENLKKFYGLDQPLPVQYFNWVGKFLTFNFGYSYTDGKSNSSKILERLPITVVINALSLLIIFLVSIPFGILGAARQNSFFDVSTTFLVFIGFAIPTFWLALLLMILFGVQLGWLPISGYQSFNAEGFDFWMRLRDWSAHLLMPVLVSAFGGLAGFSRYLRSEMLEVIRQDYVRTAFAKGLSEKMVLYKHAFRNALIPLVTILGLSVPGLIGGSVIFENIYAIPGIGQLFYQSVMQRDYPLIMGLTVIGAILTMAGNFLADIAVALVNPRIKVTEGSR
ncbi:MAG TPA: ABC transporter permease [Nitrospiria bacterium]|nr:ABC transporter permease [Nitrospiria bacterium]